MSIIANYHMAKLFGNLYIGLNDKIRIFVIIVMLWHTLHVSY